MKKFLKKVYVYGRQVYAKARIDYLTLKEIIKRPFHEGYPIPPPSMRQLTTAGHVTVTEHIQNGLQAARMLEGAITSEGKSPQSLEKVLEFGSGCGRILRHLHRAWPNTQLYGTDVDKELIKWSDNNLSGIAKWYVNDYLPPSNFEPQSFDLIYSVSVFTHMDEKAQIIWLKEFSRIIKPGGLILITVVPLEEGVTPQGWDFWNPEGMAYHYRRSEVVKRTWVKRKSDSPIFYIDAKHSANYCRSKWGELFDFVSINSGALRKAQSLVVLRGRNLVTKSD